MTITGSPDASGTTATAQHLTYIAEPPGVSPGRGYTNVVTGTGRLVMVSGQVALDEHRELVGAGDPEAQAKQVFENLRRCLAAAGAGFQDVVKLTYFVTDIAHLPAVRAARDTVMDPARLPASSAVQVSALFMPELLLEVEAFALVPEGATPEDQDAPPA
ncbi:RidA family protein [Kitasatospora sp. NPDC052868]|uniref:RidA family protein n=1 Tax=Kitasatospora sp. NPDC052868 TaxID=3364060 RepID=UPI0037C7029E